LLEPDQTDTDRVFHVSYCPHCSARDAIRLSETALERRPWRVTWRCVTCNNLAEGGKSLAVRIAHAAVVQSWLVSNADEERGAAGRTDLSPRKRHDAVLVADAGHFRGFVRHGRRMVPFLRNAALYHRYRRFTVVVGG